MMGGVMADQRLKEEFRCCGYCKSLLSHRDLLMELASSEPIIAQVSVHVYSVNSVHITGFSSSTPS